MCSSADAVPQVSHNPLCSVMKRSISGQSAPYHVMCWVIKSTEFSRRTLYLQIIRILHKCWSKTSYISHIQGISLTPGQEQKSGCFKVLNSPSSGLPSERRGCLRVGLLLGELLRANFSCQVRSRWRVRLDFSRWVSELKKVTWVSDECPYSSTLKIFLALMSILTSS